MNSRSTDSSTSTGLLFRQLLEHPRMLVFLTDSSGTLLNSSPEAHLQFVGEDKLQQPQNFLQLVRSQELKSLRDGHNPRDMPDDFDLLLHWLEQHKSERSIFHLLQTNGQHAAVVLTAFAVEQEQKPQWLFLAQNIDRENRADQALKQRDLQLKAQLASKNQILESDLLRSDDSSLVINVLAEVTAVTLNVDRVSVWFWNDDYTGMQCSTLFVRSRDEHIRLDELSESKHPKFLNLLKEQGSLRISDVMSHPDLQELVYTYFKPSLIRSMLAYPVRQRGQTRGFIFLTQTQASRDWNLDEMVFSSSIADLIAMACESQDRRQAIQERDEACRLIEKMKTHSLTGELLQSTDSSVNSIGNGATSQEQSIALHTEKMATLGTLIAGVAHEINTPLGAINASGSNLSKSLPQVLNKIPGFFKTLNEDLEDLFYKLVERSLTFSGSLSSREERQYRKQVGELLQEKNIPGARNLSKDLVKVGIIDDVDEFIPIFLEPNADEIIEMAYSIGRLRVNIDNIITAANKTQKIVFALKSYSRRNSFEEAEIANIVQNIETVLTIYHNQLKYGVEVTKDYEFNLPDLLCYPDELMQVWTNIIHNAIQAMGGKGDLHLEVKTADRNIVVRITDSGPGIPDHILSRIFDAFFTTKPEGEGSGLGLDICRRILEKHLGTVAVDTVPGRTTFIITLPLDNGLERSRMEGSNQATQEGSIPDA